MKLRETLRWSLLSGALAGLALPALELAARGPRFWQWDPASFPVATLAVLGLAGTFGLLAGVLTALPALAAASLADRLLGPRGRKVLAALTAAALAVASTQIHANSYWGLHLVLDAGLVGALQALFRRANPANPSNPSNRRLALLAAAPVAALGLTASLGDATGVASVRRGGTTSNRVATLLDRVADRDADGYASSAWLAGPDCDDADPARGPHAAEVPGNGLDDNCLGGDLAAAHAPAPPTAELAAPLQARAKHVIILSLCTFRDLPVDDVGPPFETLRPRMKWARRNRSQAPQSSESFRSMLASELPHALRFDPVRRARLFGQDPPLSLVDRLAAHGFRRGFVHHGMPRAVDWHKHRPFDFEADGDDLPARALTWLAADRDRPTFL